MHDAVAGFSPLFLTLFFLSTVRLRRWIRPSAKQFYANAYIVLYKEYIERLVIRLDHE